jgi:ABC-type sugar transport system ATPase subunit
VLNEGRIEQVGTPDDIYHLPRTRFVAEFVGSPPMNVLELEVEGGRLRATDLDLEWSHPATALPARRIGVGIRPEQVAVAPEQGPATPIPGEVYWVEYLGDQLVLDARIGGQPLKAVVPPDHAVRRPGRAFFGLTPRAEHLLDLKDSRFLRQPAATAH